MDPVTLVVAAVALGATAGLKDTAAQAVKDAYAGLKNLLSSRKVDVSALERKPGSPSKRVSLGEDLAELDGTSDAINDELLAAARRVVDAIAEHDAETAAAVGVNLRDVQSEFAKIGSGIYVTGSQQVQIGKKNRQKGTFYFGKSGPEG